MKINITNSGIKTSISLDGKDISHGVTSFTLTQSASSLPELHLRIPVTEGIEIDIPDGLVFVNGEKCTATAAETGELARKSL